MFSNKTVDGVISTFTKAIDDLISIAEKEKLKQTTFSDKIKMLEKSKQDSTIEAERAIAISGNIKALLESG